MMEMEIKFCINCKHHQVIRDEFCHPAIETHVCARFPDPVTGRAVSDCRALRSSPSPFSGAGFCGPEGKYFEQAEDNSNKGDAE